MPLPTWRVAVTRDEAADGPLATALGAAGFVPVPCPVLVEAPPSDPQALADAAARLADYEWVIVASARGVRALFGTTAGAGTGPRVPWPAGVRAAAVGAATARALAEAGVSPPPLVADGDGAEALWRTLQPAARWPGTPVLLVTTPGGRTELADALRAAGARLDVVEAYRMAPRPAAAIAAAWSAAAPDAAVVASPKVAQALAAAVGQAALARLALIVAIGPTTARALGELGLACVQPPRADFTLVAEVLAEWRAAGAPR